MTSTCTHINDVRDVSPSTPDGCEECLETGGQWKNLRLCMTCGHVGCCDDSPNRHARGHAGASGHGIIEPFKQAGAEWRWCLIDDMPV